MSRLATKLENLRGKSSEIVETREDLKEKKYFNAHDRAMIKEILSGELRDDTDLSVVSHLDEALGTEKKNIEEKVTETTKETKIALEETDAYIHGLEENLSKLEELEKTSDLSSSEKVSIGNTKTRIDELKAIREMLSDEGLAEGQHKFSGDAAGSDNYLERKSFIESLRESVEQANYKYCLGVLVKGELPSGYERIITDRYDNAEVSVKKVFNHYANQLTIKDSNYPTDKVQHYMPNGVLGHPRGVYYNAMEDANNPRGNGSTYFHELAHMIDHASTGFNKNLSCNDEFRQALISDASRILDAYNKCSIEQKRNFISSLRMNDRTHSFQDLLEGTTNGVISVGWGHGKDYWTRPGNLQAEAFAHFFEASMGAPDKLATFTRYFPTAFAKFSEMIESIVPDGYEKVLVRERSR